MAAKKKDDKVEDKGPDISSLINSLNKKFGVNTINVGFPKRDGKLKTIERIPTGSFSLDCSLGGGLPLGRFIEISGAFSAVKTTQTIHIIREAQKRGLVCALLDIENTTTPEYLESLGVDTSTLLYSNPDGAEEATQLLIDMQRSECVHFAVLDSIAALCPTKERDSDMDETIQMGGIQKLLGEYFRKWQAANNRLVREGKRPFTLIGINQLRDTFNKYEPERAPGGRGKDFFSSVNIRLRRGDWISEGTGESKEITGCVIKYKIDKNKTYKRMQTGEFDFYLAPNVAGIPEGYNDNIKEVIVASIEHGIIDRRGGWFYLNDEEKYQGLDRLVEALKQDEEKVNNLKQQVLNLLESRALV